MIVELKYDKSVSAAIQQIKDDSTRRHLRDMLLVGVNYDKENPDKPHSCVIEQMEYKSK